jgi:hypothetical protein
MIFAAGKALLLFVLICNAKEQDNGDVWTENVHRNQLSQPFHAVGGNRGQSLRQNTDKESQDTVTGSDFHRHVGVKLPETEHALKPKTRGMDTSNSAALHHRDSEPTKKKPSVKLHLSALKQRADPKTAKKDDGSKNPGSGFVVWCAECFGVKANNGRTTLESVAYDSTMKLFWLVAGAIFVVLGFFLCFFGYAHHQLSIGTIGCFVSFMAGFLFICGVAGACDLTGMAGVIVSVVIGLVTAFLGTCFVLTFETCSFVLVGFVGGLVIAIELNSLVLHLIWDAMGADSTGAKIGWSVVVLGFAIFGGLLATFEWSRRPLMVVATAFAGADMLAWGILQIIFGSTMVTVQLNPLVMYGDTSWSAEPETFLALGGMLMLSAFGAVIQWYYTAQKFTGKQTADTIDAESTEPLKGSHPKADESTSWC